MTGGAGIRRAWPRSNEAIALARSLLSPFTVLAVGVIVATIALMHANRGTTFLTDEWDWVGNLAGAPLDAYLQPHNQHASLAPILVYKLLFKTVGLSHYWVYRLVHVALMEALAVAVYFYARARIGRWWALGPALALALVGSAHEYVLVTFEMTFTMSLLAGVGALLCFDRESPRWDAAASALLTVSVFSSGVGLPILLAAAVEVALRPDRGERWRLLVAPAVLYGAWWLGYHQGDYPLSNVIHAPTYAEVAYNRGIGALTSLTTLSAAVAVAAAILFLASAVGAAGRRARFWCLVTAPLAFWASTAIVRYGMTEPENGRYAVPSATFLALLVCESLAGRTLPLPNRRAWAIGGAALAALLVNNLGHLSNNPFPFRQTADFVRGELTALELARDTATPDYQPDTVRARDITARRYFNALDAYPGSPAYPPDVLATRGPDVRAQADRVLREAIHPAVAAVGQRPVAPDLIPRPTSAVEGGTATPESDGCLLFRPSGSDGSLFVQLPGQRLVVENTGSRAQHVDVAIRRFGDDFGDPIGTVAARSVGGLTFPAAGLPAHPWFVKLTASTPFSACAAR